MGKNKTKARKRIQEAKGPKGIQPKSFDYIEKREGIGIDSVACTLCGALLKKLVPLPDLGKEETINGQRVITQPVALRETNNYAEITIEFDDGSAHTTMTCRSCANELDEEQLEILYASDMEQFDKDEQAGQGAVRWELMAHRKPKGFVRDR